MALFALLAYRALRLTLPPAEARKVAPAMTGHPWHRLACGPDCVGRLDQRQLRLAGLRHGFSDLPGTVGATHRLSFGVRPMAWHWRELHGGVLDAAARTAIQLAHRLGAAAVFCYLLVLTLLALRQRGTRMRLRSPWVRRCCYRLRSASAMSCSACPPVATARNAGAALLLLALLALLVRLRPPHGSSCKIRGHKPRYAACPRSPFNTLS